MGQVIKTFAPPTTSSFPLDLLAGSAQLGGLTSVQTIEVDNGSSLTLSVFGDGQLIRTLTPYVSRWNINTAGGWQDITITANTAAIQATDQITIIAYDQVVPILFPPSFGVSAWGAGAVPSHLVSITPGNQLLAWNVQQLINLLTGVMTGQIVLVTNTIQTQGAGGQFLFSDRDGIGGDSFAWYAQSGVAHLSSSVLGTDALSIDESGNFRGAARIISNATGASAKALDNLFPISPPSLTSLSGAGAVGVTAFTVTGLSTTAVMCSLWLRFNGAAGQIFDLLDGASNITLNIVGTGSNTNIGVLTPCTPGATNQLQYQVIGAGAWTCNVNLLGNVEPS